MAKKKVKAPTIEELKLKIKHEKASYWLHSDPLFGIIQNMGETQFIGVDPRVEQQILFCFILDPVDFSIERTFDFLQQLNARYRKLDWFSSIVFQAKYPFTVNPLFWERLKANQQYLDLPIYNDSFNDFLDFYQTQNCSKLLVFCEGKLNQEFLLDSGLPQTWLEVESLLQRLLRRKDPGLPLPLLYEYTLAGALDVARFPLDDLPKTGHWTKVGDAWVTDDLHSTLSIPFSGKYLRLVASLHTQAREPKSEVSVMFNDKPLAPQNLGESIEDGHQGQSIVSIGRYSGMYDLFKSSQLVDGTITLHFKDASNNPITLYGLRIG